MGVSSSSSIIRIIRIICIIRIIRIICIIIEFFRWESQILQLDDDVEATMGGRDVCAAAHAFFRFRSVDVSLTLGQAWCDVCSLAHEQLRPDSSAASVANGCARELSALVTE